MSGRAGGPGRVVLGFGAGRLAIAASLVFGACELPERPPPALCQARDWCWENPLPQGNALLGVWQSGPASAVVVGARGLIMQRRNRVWQIDDSGTPSTLAAVWGASDRDVWAVGAEGTILHFDGESWRTHDSGTTAFLTSVHGTSSSDVWTVGGVDTILHWDGAGWRTAALGGGTRVRAVWANARDDVWVAGQRGVDTPSGSVSAATALHWDGHAWQESLVDAREGSRSSLSTIWSSGPGDVWAGGDSGAFQATNDRASLTHFDGTTWTTYPLGLLASNNLSIDSIWGSGPADVWAGAREVAIHFDGTSWRASSDEKTKNMRGISGRDAASAVAINDGGRVIHWNGDRWNDWHQAVTGDAIVDAWAGSPDDVWAVTATEVLHFDGFGWSVSHSDAGAPFVAVHGNDDGVWAARRDGTLASWTRGGNAWSATGGSMPEPVNVADVWLGPGTPPEIWAVGAVDPNPSFLGAGRVLRLARDPYPPRWIEVPVTAAPPEGLRPLDAIAGSSASDLWVVGMDVTPFHFDGTTWTAVPVPDTFGFFSDVWENAPDDVWVVGNGPAWHFDGAAFVMTPVPGILNSRAIWSDGPASAWVVGHSGGVARWDGGAWTAVDAGTATHFSAVWQTSDGVVRLFGDAGAILRR